MSELKLENIEKGFTFYYYCNNTINQNVSLPFFGDTSKKLKDEGFADDTDSFVIPPNLFLEVKDTTYHMDLGASAFIIGLSIFLGTSIGSWSVGKLCNYLYDEKLKPALTNLKQKVASQGYTNTINLHFGVWYDIDKVYVNVIVNVNTPNDMHEIEAQIQTAHQMAAKIIQDNKPTNQVITYKIVGGKLSDEPIIGDRIHR